MTERFAARARLTPEIVSTMLLNAARQRRSAIAAGVARAGGPHDRWREELRRLGATRIRE